MACEALRYSMRLNGASVIALTKMDVLTGMKEIKVCTAYERNETKTDRFNGDFLVLEEYRPVFETLGGWDEDISACGTFESLPATAQKYVEYIEKGAGAPVQLIGTGPDRNQTINRGL